MTVAPAACNARTAAAPAEPAAPVTSTTRPAGSLMPVLRPFLAGDRHEIVDDSLAGMPVLRSFLERAGEMS